MQRLLEQLAKGDYTLERTQSHKLQPKNTGQVSRSGNPFFLVQITTEYCARTMNPLHELHR